MDISHSYDYNIGTTRLFGVDASDYYNVSEYGFCGYNKGT